MLGQSKPDIILASVDLESYNRPQTTQKTFKEEEEVVVVNSLDGGRLVAQILDSHSKAYGHHKNPDDLTTIRELKYEASSDEELSRSHASLALN